MSISELARAVAREAGIPEAHLSAVVERARDMHAAVIYFAGYYGLWEMGGSEAVVVRTVSRAVEDLARGALERRVE